MSLERQCVFNPKPKGNFVGGAVFGWNRGAHYNRKQHRKNNLYVCADNGHYVNYKEPIYIYSRGLGINGYYIIKNKKPREVLNLNTYNARYRRYLKKYPTAVDQLDFSAILVEIVYNDANSANIYLDGQSNREVSSNIEIQKMKVSGNNWHTYYVITEEGHIDPVLSKKRTRSKTHNAEYMKPKKYKNKVEETKKENPKKRKERDEVAIENRNLKVKFTCSITEEDLEKERERERELLPVIKFNIRKSSRSSLSEQGLFAQQIQNTTDFHDNNTEIISTPAIDRF
jgi:hypothetical protein